jgi:hypothetical protein
MSSEPAGAFVEFACSERGKGIFRKHGHTVTEPE